MEKLKTLNINTFQWIIETPGYKGYTIEIHVMGIETRKEARKKLLNFSDDIKKGNVEIE